MKVLVSYRFTGESTDKLELLLSTVCDALREAGAEPYCLYFDQESECITDEDPAEMMQATFREIDHTDILFVVQSGEARSEGMLMEVGYAIAKGVPVMVATQAAVKETYLPAMASQAIRYDDNEDLRRQIMAFDFSEL